MPTTERKPIATTEMIIRKPVDQFFNALIDSAITTQFWITKSSGKLALVSASGGIGKCTMSARMATSRRSTHTRAS